MPRIESLNVGHPKALQHGTAIIQSAIARASVDRPLMLELEGFQGDQVADTRHHGGPDKAVNVYALEHYVLWNVRLGRTLEIPAFGENLTITGLLEADVCIGDTFRVGSSVLQVSQPRVPCFKPAALHGQPELTVWMLEAGLTGWYFRVLQPGMVAPHDDITLLEPSRSGLSVAEANRIMHHDRHDLAGARRLASVPELAQVWREGLQGRIEKLGLLEGAGVNHPS